MLTTFSPQSLDLVSRYAEAFNRFATYDRAKARVQLRAPQDRDHRSAPWVAALDDFDLHAFAVELHRDLVFAHQTGDTTALQSTITEWSVLARLLTPTQTEMVRVSGARESTRLLTQVLELV